MWVRFTCPACRQTHQMDMPETTIHMTCGQTGQAIEVRLTGGGDIKSKVVGAEEAAEEAADNQP